MKRYVKSFWICLVAALSWSSSFAGGMNPISPDSLRSSVVSAFAKEPKLNLEKYSEVARGIREVEKRIAARKTETSPYLRLKSLRQKLYPEIKVNTALQNQTMKRLNLVSKLRFIVNVPRVRVKPPPKQTKDYSQPKPVEDDEINGIKLKKESAASCTVDIDRFRTFRKADYFFAYKQTANDGAWGDGGTWVGGVAPASTDSVQINHHVTMPSGTTTNAGIYVAPAGWLEYQGAVSSQLDISRNFIIEGLLTMEPNAHSVVHRIRFVNINEELMQGGGMDVLVNDVGIWVMDGGRVSLRGSAKTSWTNATGSVSAGATSMTLVDVTGWQVGDEIVIAATEEDVSSAFDWDDTNQIGIDPFIAHFERRTITSIVGNVVSWTTPLVYNHLAVSSSIGAGTYAASSRSWTAEVANMTRNVKIGGSGWQSKSHMFIRNEQYVVQNLLYIEFTYTGPTKINPAIHASRETLVSGRYTVHIHFSAYYSQGSLVYGCTSSYSGNRVFVPHESSKITMNNNVAFDSQEAMFWWDMGETSNFITWEHNLMMAMRYNGGFDIQFSMMISQGDGNAARHNVAVYTSNWNLHGTGAYIWQANNEGVWIFEFNMAHSCGGAGLWVWQNTSLNHTIIFYDSYYCAEAITHGAYSNSYEYTFGHHYRSLIFIEATSANSNGAVFKGIYVDAGGQDYGFWIVESPVPSTAFNSSNKLIECVVKNYAVAGVNFKGQGVGGFAEQKWVDLINCDIGSNSGDEYNWDDEFAFNNGSRITLQKIGSGTNRQDEQVSGSKVTTSGFADFYPNNIGDGLLGLRGDYYNQNGFADYKVSRREAILMFDVWRPDGAILPQGVHHLVTAAVETPPNSGTFVQTDATYSIEWRGQFQTFAAGDYDINTAGTGKIRAWVDDGGGEDLLIDEWATTGVDTDAFTGNISLAAGTKYNIRIQFQNNGAAGASPQGFMLKWKHPGIAGYELIPQSQLFGTTNNAPVAAAGADQTLIVTATSTTLNASMTKDEDGRVTGWSWSKISGPGTPTFGNSTAVGTGVYNLEEGTYVFRVTATDNDSATSTDDVTVTVGSGGPPPTGDAKFIFHRRVIIRTN